MTSVLSLFLVSVDQLVFLCFSFCFSTCLHFVVIVGYNFTISCLKLKYVLSQYETGKLHILYKMILNFKRMFLGAVNKKKTDCRTCFYSQSNTITSDSNIVF